MRRAAPDSLFVSVEEAAEDVGISAWAYYEAVKRNEVPYRRIGRLIRVPRKQLAEFAAGTWKPADAEMAKAA